MPNFPMIAAVVAVLVTSCMSGPIPVQSGGTSDNSVNPAGPSEEKLPGSPATRSATP